MIKEILLLSAGIILFLFGMNETEHDRAAAFYPPDSGIYQVCRQETSLRFVDRDYHHRALSKQFGDHFLTVGMVSAGLITFYHSLGIILGADIGTTVTIFLVVWKFTDMSPLFLIVGGILWISGNSKRWKTIGEAVFYFGLIFFGLSLASLATVPLKDHPAIIRFFQEARNPLLGLVIGILFTGIVHASAIPISILVILAQNHLMSLEVALADCLRRQCRYHGDRFDGGRCGRHQRQKKRDCPFVL